MDITYVPMARGFMYLAAVIDWYSRPSWPSGCRHAGHRVLRETVAEALQRYDKPEIFNTDQGCQFISEAFTRLLKEAGVTISMDGNGCWRDNVFVERLWKPIKYEEVYLKGYDSVSHARQSLANYIVFYNTRRPHSRLDRRTPDQVYFNQPPPLPKAV